MHGIVRTRNRSCRPDGCRRTHRQGFLLLTTLVAIVLAELLLFEVAQRSLLAALDAVSAQEELQRKWGSVGLQRLLLRPYALTAEEGASQPGENRSSNQDARRRTFKIKLGEMTMQLVLADECAKINVNTLLELQGKRETEAVIQGLRGPARKLVVRLRPLPVTDAWRQPAVDSWGQVFDLQRESGSAEAIIRATEHLTCWGDGTINVRSASEEALDAFCHAALPARQADEIMNSWRARFPQSVAEFVQGAALTPEQRILLLQYLAEQSHCSSLWIGTANGRRSWHELYVLENSPEQGTHVLSFTW